MKRHKAIQVDLLGNTKSNAMMVKTIQHNNTKGQSSRRNQKKDDRIYDYCKATGHLKDACFKLHGYPDWYK